MGYTTEFGGSLTFDEPLTTEQVSQLKQFAEERHGGNVEPHPEMPGFWCQWVPTEDGTALEWDGNEKFYNYVEWLEYLITHFINYWNRKLNGEITWYGEDRDDIGKIIVKDNIVTTQEGQITYQEE